SDGELTARAIRELLDGFARRAASAVRESARRRTLSTVGFADEPTSADDLGREQLMAVLADLWARPGSSLTNDTGDARGPTVVSIEGRWGSGKSSLLQMLKRNLEALSEKQAEDDAAARRSGPSPAHTGKPTR